MSVLAGAGISHGATFSSGSATVNYNEGVANPIGFFDALFTETTPFATASATAAPGNKPFTRISGTPGTIGTGSTVGVAGTPGEIQLNDPMRPFGAVLPTVAGRLPQASTLDVDLTSAATVLSTWGASSNDFGGLYVGSVTKGEQIAFTNEMRWGGPFTGALYYSDLTIRYEPTRVGTIVPGGTLSGLVLTANDNGFAGAAFADIGNASIVPNATTGTLSITGDLLTSGGLGAFGAPVGVDFGNFSFTAVVPEPASLGFIGFGALSLITRRRKQTI